MGKTTKALHKAQQERTQFRQQQEEQVIRVQQLSRRGAMKNSWFIWIFIVGVIVTVLVAFNREGGQSDIPLAEIFPEDAVEPVDIEYEFADEGDTAARPKPSEESVSSFLEGSVEPSGEIALAVQDDPGAARRRSLYATKTEDEISEATASTRVTSQPVRTTSETAPDAQVRAEAEPRPAETAPPPQSDTQTEVLVHNKSIPFAIQVASFRNEKRAQDKASELKNNNFNDVYIVSRQIEGRGTWYRVYIGKFETRAQASDFLPNVRAKYEDSFIITSVKPE